MGDSAFSCFVLSEGVFIIGGNIAYEEKKPVSSRQLCYSKYFRATFMQILAGNRAARREVNETAITIKRRHSILNVIKTEEKTEKKTEDKRM